MVFSLVADDAPINVVITHAAGTVSEIGYYNTEFGNYWTTGEYVLPASTDYTFILTSTGDTATPYEITFRITDQDTGSPQTPERVGFEDEASEAERTGTLDPGLSKSYVLRAAAGQSMWYLVTADSAPIDVEITFSDGAYADEGYYNGEFEIYWTEGSYILPVAGDYVYTITNVGEMTTEYNIVFGIATGDAGLEPPERVSFPAGASSVELEGMASSTAVKAYALEAVIGQELSILAVSHDGPVFIAVYEPGGAPVADNQGTFEQVDGAYRTHVTLALAESGDYIVHLWLDSLESVTAPYVVEFAVE
jgi:hypothetical protein